MTDRNLSRWITVFFVSGLVLSGLMVARSQVAGDQLELLGSGWFLAFEGEWLPFGGRTSAGGRQPGVLLSLLVGLPFLVWPDHRSATVLVWVTHLVAYLALDRLVRRTLGAQERFLFAVLYWLNPWRIYHSGYLWSPNFFFLLGALHLLTAYELRERARFWPSLAHVVVVGLAMQINLSALSLALASGLLWWKGYLRIAWRGAVVGGLLVAITLVPWALAVFEDASLLPGGESFVGSGFVTVYPLVQGAVTWLRYPALALSRSMVCLDFSDLGGPSWERMESFLSAGRWILGLLTLPLIAWANWRLWRRPRRRLRPAFEISWTDRFWLKGVIRWTFLATILTCGLSPVSISRWYLLPEFHLSVLAVVLVAGPLLRTRWSARIMGLVWTAAAAFLLLAVAFVAGAPPYRCGGPRCGIRAVTMPSLRSDHRMLDDLGIRATCPVVVDDPDGWWPAVLSGGGAPEVRE